MLDKSKKVLSIILVLILVFSVIYGLINIVLNLFEKPVLMNISFLEEYTKNENLVLDYKTYYYLTDCFNNFVEGCKQEKYNELYNIYINDYKKLDSKKEIVRKLSNVKSEFESGDNEYKIENIYLVNDIYLLEVNMKEEKSYYLFNLSDDKKYDYYFAFLK